MVLAILNIPKFPIGIKNHEYIFIKYYKNRNLAKLVLHFSHFFYNFLGILLVQKKKEKGNDATVWAKSGPSRPKH
jgi:hypothetical protein